jgi:hypothetical protein
MDDTIEKAFVGLGVAAVFGLAFLAYKHPKAYQKLFVALFALVSGVFVSLFAWNVAIVTVRDAVIRSGVLGDRIGTVLPIIESIGIPNWWFLMYPCVSIYLIFLFTFPVWLLEDEPPQGKDDKK